MSNYTELIQNNEHEMIENCTAMNKIKKIYNTASIIYIIVIGVYAILILPLAFSSPLVNPGMAFCEALLIKPATAACGFLSCYKKNNVLVIAAFLIQLVSAIINGVSGTFIDYILLEGVTGLSANRLILVLVIVLCMLTFFANTKYAYLKEQPGFPHFNERRFDQEFDKQQRGIKDEFQMKYERLQKTSTDEMSDITTEKRNDFMVSKSNPITTTDIYNNDGMDSL